MGFELPLSLLKIVGIRPPGDLRLQSADKLSNVISVRSETMASGEKEEDIDRRSFQIRSVGDSSASKVASSRIMVRNLVT